MPTIRQIKNWQSYAEQHSMDCWPVSDGLMLCIQWYHEIKSQCYTEIVKITSFSQLREELGY